MIKSKTLTFLSMLLISSSASWAMENDENNDKNGVKIYLQDEDCVSLGAKFIPTELTINNTSIKPERIDEKWIWNLPVQHDFDNVLPIKMEYSSLNVTTRWKRHFDVEMVILKGKWVEVVDSKTQKSNIIMTGWGLGVLLTGGILLPPCLYYYCKEQDLKVEKTVIGYDTLIKDPKNKNLRLKIVQKKNGEHELKTTVCDDK